MIKCDFCEAIRENHEGYTHGWGHAKLQIGDNPPVEVTFCPKHRKEAEKKLLVNNHQEGMMDIMKRTIRLKEGVDISERDKAFLVEEMDDAINEALCELGFADSVDVITDQI